MDGRTLLPSVREAIEEILPLEPAQNIEPVGWALSKRRAFIRFSLKVKKFLVDKFEEGNR